MKYVTFQFYTGKNMAFNDRITWSVFRWLIDTDEPAQQQLVAEVTGLNRKTIAAAQGRLEQAGLFINNEPVVKPDYFFERKDGKGLAGCRVKAPNADLSALGAVLLGFLESSGKGETIDTSYAGLITMIGATKPALKNALDELQSKNLLRYGAAKRFANPLRISVNPDPPCFFQEVDFQDLTPYEKFLAVKDRQQDAGEWRNPHVSPLPMPDGWDMSKPGPLDLLASELGM